MEVFRFGLCQERVTAGSESLLWGVRGEMFLEARGRVIIVEAVVSEDKELKGDS